MILKALKCCVAAAALGAASLLPAKTVHAGANPFIGDVMLVGFNFCPRGWIPANGQLLPIAQNTALFSLYGTLYGGDGRSTFGVPDLRGRVPVSFGQSPGLSNYVQGQKVGNETHTLTVPEMPSHNHTANGVLNSATSPSPNNALPGTAASNAYASGATPNLQFQSNFIGDTGGNRPFDIRQPTLAMLWCVATQGVYPSRS